MPIQIRLNDLREGYDWIYGAEFYMDGYLGGYIQGEVEIYENQPYSAEFLFRVRDDENGAENKMVHFSNPPTDEQKSRVDEVFTQLENKLADLSIVCGLADIIGADIPDDICTLEITEDDEDYYLRIDGETSYNLDRWTIDEAIDYHCSDEAAMERDIATRRAWGFYD